MLDEKKKEPKEPTAADPYAHRAHRTKYQRGYGCEGAARGEVHIGGDAAKVSPRDDSDKASEEAEHAYEPRQEQ